MNGQPPVLLGRERGMQAIPYATWAQHVTAVQTPAHANERIGWMSVDHRRVREYVVRELPRAGTPLAPQTIAAVLALPAERVAALLLDLERRLFFLVRDAQGAVEWAFPLTIAPTPHRLIFDSGERLYGA